MNALDTDAIFMRSMATRRSHLATNEMLQDAIALLKHAGYDLVIVETAGIGQGGSEIVDLVDLSLYVMTSEYGAASQLEKIDMIDYADIIVLNKYEKQGALDAVRDIKKQWRRSRKDWDIQDEKIPVYPTIASQFNRSRRQSTLRNDCRTFDSTILRPEAGMGRVSRMLAMLNVMR